MYCLFIGDASIFDTELPWCRYLSGMHYCIAQGTIIKLGMLYCLGFTLLCIILFISLLYYYYVLLYCICCGNEHTYRCIVFAIKLLLRIVVRSPPRRIPLVTGNERSPFGRGTWSSLVTKRCTAPLEAPLAKCRRRRSTTRAGEWRTSFPQTPPRVSR